MRYGLVKTQKTANRSPVHWLRRGTLVRILRDDYIETMYPVFGVSVTQWPYRVVRQIVRPGDVFELPQWLGPMLEWFAPKFQRAREWLGWA
ncbi:hypothetical protein BTI_1583 [Burkholderia thailandensis MSMB121]|uniref:hypothetical protein n=1 Tax=Burkholderia humptydooensis TaxID=430531 RepID=UPI0003281001|nr:hypothetical protein [Burkholderia humptydooensis]AGK46063.1 hypothetical protein BTI_1583 [Burkholderia thailandensis MSMB121]ATF36663.1 hypothetical protein CO709_27615 [Burkholderia thailandensis]KST74041.1 hypothetical protein WS76_07650 [Burkholderia humptydooensis]